MRDKHKEKENKYEELRQKYLYGNIKSDKPEQTKYYETYVE